MNGVMAVSEEDFVKASRVRNQQGFTLIEVSLAIVIGVIVLGGAIVLYNQTKTSSANSTAGAKSLALQSLVEEMAAANSGNYGALTVGGLASTWSTRRSADAQQSPYGGSYAGNSVQAFAANWAGAAGTTAPAAVAASAGVAVFVNTGTTTPQSIWDNNAVATKSFGNYVVGIYDGTGVQAFLNGK